MKQKKKKQVNNKFNFDDDYIIGVSNSASSSKPKKVKKKKKNNNKNKATKNNKNISMKKNKSRVMNERKSKLKKRLIKIFLIVCLLVGAGCFLCLSPIFDLQEIIVENNNQISADTIRSLSQIELYKNIFLIDKSEAEKHVEENSYINSVKISWVLPDKIKITVEERNEKYLLEFAEGKYAILDSQGYVLNVTSELKEGLTVITGAETNIEELVKINSNKNRLCEADLKKLGTVANIVDTCQNYEVYSFITKIDISDEDNITLILEGEDKIVYLGSCSDLNTRILYMKEIINAEKGKSGEMFINGNLSEDNVYFRENV